MVRGGFLRMVLSVLVAITLVAGLSRPCAACANMPAPPQTRVAMADMASADMASGMDDCHHMAAKAPGQPAKHFGCLHCLAFGSIVLMPGSAGLEATWTLAAPPAARLAALPQGILTSPDTGPPRGQRI